MALGSLGSGALPVYDPVKRIPVLSVLRQGVGETIALTLVYGGLAILVLAWLYLGRSVRRREPGTEESRLLRIGALWAAPLLFAVPLFSRDLYSYAAQAQITHGWTRTRTGRRRCPARSWTRSTGCGSTRPPRTARCGSPWAGWPRWSPATTW
jgi:hypothetical protein